MALVVGQLIDGKYRVDRRIGEGGMGTVYEGENTRIGRRVAIKVLNGDTSQTPELRVRFDREARAVARLGSPHICEVLDLGDLPGGDTYLVMEFLDGVGLDSVLEERGKIAVEEVVPVAYQLLEGLATLHGAGIVHRDLKPANVFITKGARTHLVKILDFGVSKVMPKADEAGQMTATGAVMGTPLYMSPEQARGQKDIDGRSDLYAVGVMFYRCVTGELPFVADNFHELLFKIALEAPKSVTSLAPEVDAELAAMIHKALAKDPNDRFANARVFQDALVAWNVARGTSALAFEKTVRTEPPPRESGPNQSARVVVRTPGQGISALLDERSAPKAWEGPARISRPDSQDAPLVEAPKTLAAGDAPKSAIEPLTPEESEPAHAATHGDAESRHVAPKRRGPLLTAAVAIVGLALGATVLALRTPTSTPTSGAPPAADSSIANTPPADHAASANPATPIASAPAPVEPASPSAAIATASSAPDPHAPAMPRPRTDHPKSPQITSAAPIEPAPAPAPSASAHGRKIRTDL